MDTKEISKWQEEEFLPWKEAYQAYENERLANEDKIKQHAQEVKHIVALLLDGKEDEAVFIWNQLAFKPALKSLDLKRDKGLLVMETESEQKVELSLQELLALLQGILK